jgi:hypothetical protein
VCSISNGFPGRGLELERGVDSSTVIRGAGVPSIVTSIVALVIEGSGVGETDGPADGVGDAPLWQAAIANDAIARTIMRRLGMVGPLRRVRLALRHRSQSKRQAHRVLINLRTQESCDSYVPRMIVVVCQVCQAAQSENVCPGAGIATQQYVWPGLRWKKCATPLRVVRTVAKGFPARGLDVDRGVDSSTGTRGAGVPSIVTSIVALVIEESGVGETDGPAGVGDAAPLQAATANDAIATTTVRRLCMVGALRCVSLAPRQRARQGKRSVAAIFPR